MMLVFAAVLASLWSAGCFGLPLWGAYCLFFEECEKGVGIFVLTIGWPIGVIGALLPWYFWYDHNSPALATLHKDRWFCSATHPETVTTYVKSGSVMVPITSTHQVCDQYNRR